MEIQRESLPEFFAGNGSVGTTAAKLTGTISIPVLKHVVVRADSGNASTIKASHSAAGTATGFILAAGEQVTIYIDATDKIWVLGGAASQAFSWIAS